MKPLRINFEIAGLIERTVRPIHLDSLIAHQLVRSELPEYASESQISNLIENLPLDRREIGGTWVWAASTIAFNWIAPPQQRFATRAVRVAPIVNAINAGLFTNIRSRGRVDTTRGAMKNATYAHEMQQAPRAVAYCIGDADRIQSLLSGLRTLGGRRRISSAKILAVDIIEDDDAFDLWQKRYLPYDADVGRATEGAYRLPLFRKANQTIIRDNSLTWSDIASRMRANMPPTGA